VAPEARRHWRGEPTAAFLHEAAKAISNTAQRDQSLSAVAGDAAKEGDAAVVKKCIQLITSSPVKDDAAFTAAVALAKAEKGQEGSRSHGSDPDDHQHCRKDEASTKIARSN
jgi:hypothetical protein